jgi:hypothetical protein
MNNINIPISDIKLNIIYNNTTYTNNVPDVDVTIPFFIFIINFNKTNYKMGSEISWHKFKLRNQATFDIHELYKTKNDFNLVDVNNKPNHDECLNSFFFSSRKYLRVTVEYEWTLSHSANNDTHTSKLLAYNQIINVLMKNKNISDLLSSIEMFNTHLQQISSLFKDHELHLYDNNNFLFGEHFA